MLRPRRSLVTASLVASLAFACAPQDEVAKNTDPSDEASCDTSFEARASRPGTKRQARLSYGCAADACGGNEAFAAGTMQLVTVDVPSTVASSLEITSSDPSVIRAMRVEVSLDLCLGLTRAYVSLQAASAGEASLRVTAEGVTDDLPVRVVKADAVSLRASTLGAFELSKPGEITAVVGESLLIVPALVSADGEALRGVPALSWSAANGPEVTVPDPIASIRLDATSEDERFLRDWAAPSAVFLDTKQIGRSVISVQTNDGAQGVLTVHVVAPKQTLNVQQ